MLDFIVMQMSKINHKRAISKESLTNWLTDCLSTWGTDHEDSVGHVQTDRMPEWMTEKLSINQCITLENVDMRHSKQAIKKLVVFQLHHRNYWAYVKAFQWTTREQNDETLSLHIRNI